MEVLNFWIKRQISFCLVTLLVVPIGAAEIKPLLPGTQDAAPSNAMSAQSQTADQGQKSSAPTSPPSHQESPVPEPGGTAAAPYVEQEGVSATRPSGAAIAPAKQRRTRSFAIRAGLLVGAAVAIGVVTAASLGSPSRTH